MSDFIEPWKTLVQLADEGFSNDYFPNFRILGEYSGDEVVDMNAWSIVGLAPGYHTFLECHLITGKETDKPFWVSELRDTLPALSTAQDFNEAQVLILGGAVHSRLGLDKHHVVGIISLHQTRQSKQSFAILWINPEIKRPLVEQIMKYVLEGRLKT